MKFFQAHGMKHDDFLGLETLLDVQVLAPTSGVVQIAFYENEADAKSRAQQFLEAEGWERVTLEEIAKPANALA